MLPAAPATDLPRQILGSGILWRTAGIGLGTLIVARSASSFCRGSAERLTDATGQQALVGYNPNVKLGDLGPLLQNHRTGDEVESSTRPGNLVEPPAPPLLRGSLLNYYHRGEWKLTGQSANQQRAGSLARRRISRCIRNGSRSSRWRDPVLFGVYPVYRSDARRKLAVMSASIRSGSNFIAHRPNRPRKSSSMKC